MSGMHDAAVEAMENLLAELPYEFGLDPETTETRSQFMVIKERNVRRVHRALWDLQVYLGMREDDERSMDD